MYFCSNASYLYVSVYFNGGNSHRLLNCSLTCLSEPDVGMAEKDAHRFFLQLIAAVVSEANLWVDVTFCMCFFC